MAPTVIATWCATARHQRRSNPDFCLPVGRSPWSLSAFQRLEPFDGVLRPRRRSISRAATPTPASNRATAATTLATWAALPCHSETPATIAMTATHRAYTARRSSTASREYNRNWASANAAPMTPKIHRLPAREGVLAAADE